ncbi:AI-2E family transporter [Marichromatium gracile]|uniref:Putative PurR-regulated permease PerM n=1 Tax=Marichromatium gracile TaxID=1048 RepID=A0A4R4ADP9_MARGR|nr:MULTISPECIES: AI-2E family transporter [Marichromatium]MBO8086285.1 AI-2E family transporter [Marichromatium sp.]MBK1709032.1 hypothetical protein [Marichromatium gracile]MCF1183441.1 AI-2E family transporter [Marichromatium gracile]RNE89827.1 AI-2E family transporter [Marichromatium sp. AB32]RNE91683.1 AI-2E family transporter [Marichromatium sp. AB31]
MSEEIGFSSAARLLLVAGAFVVVIAGMQAASSLIAPFLLAVFIAVIASPPLGYLRRRGLPNGLALVAVMLGLVGVGSIAGVLVAGSLGGFEASLPEYQERLKQLTGELVGWLDGIGIHTSREALQTYIDPARALGFAGELISGLSGALTNTFLILLTVVFILLEATNLPAKLTLALKTPEASIARLKHVLDSVNHYMGLKTVTSLGTGFAVWVWLAILGVDFAVLWAAVAFLLNFVPTIGSILAAIPAVLLALVQLDLQSALLVALGYVSINTLVGNILEPRIMGRGLGLSTLVVFVSLVFWGWVLGPVGMFLSVPLTMSLKIALDATPQTRPIAILLGPEVTTGDTREAHAE